MCRKKLIHLHAREYEHPFDRKALEALEATPGLPALVKTVRKYSFDKIQKIVHTGSYLQIGENQYPHIYQLFTECCEILDFPSPPPKLYMSQMYEINAYATCFAEPIVVITSGCLDVLSHDEVRFILGHELGHIKSQHLLYHDLANTIAQIGSILGDMTLGIGGVLSLGLQIALLYWQRMSEFTSDRAGLLASQNYPSTISVIAKMAGVTRKDPTELNVAEFMNQVKQFEGFDYDSFDKIAKYYSVMEQSHPWTVMRAAELEKWVQSGQYEAILNRKTQRQQASLTSLHASVNRCRQCGNPIGAADRFCGKCGTAV